MSSTFREALRLGVRIEFGTDSGVSTHGRNACEFRLMVGLGMTPAAALKAATSVDAELLGLSKTVGTLEPGKLADGVAVGNPFADITATERDEFVVEEGKVVVSKRRLGVTRPVSRGRTDESALLADRHPRPCVFDREGRTRP